MKFHLHPCRPQYRHGLFWLFLVTSTAGAQTAAPPTPAPTPQPPPVRLSPFVVDDTQDVGYLASNTLAGSRFNTALKDTPATISVLTSEFLADVGAFQLDEALVYAVNVERDFDDARETINENATFQNYPTYRVRGLEASVSRNYFGWADRAIPAESAFVDRIEDSRGPNAVLFGIASPGGVINVNTKQALTGRTIRELSATYGSFDTRRFTLDLNHPLVENRLAARLILVYNKNNEFRHFAHQEHQRGLLTTRYQVTDRTRFRIDFERGQFQSNTPRAYNLDNSFLRWHAAGRPTFTDVPAPAQRTQLGMNQRPTAAAQPQVTYISNLDAAIAMRGTLVTTGAIPPGQEGLLALNGVITDRSISDYSINVGGPAQDRFTRYGIFTAVFEHELAPHTFLELGYNHVGMTLDSRDPRGGNSLLGDPNARLLTGAPNPFAGQLYLDTNWFRTVRDDTIDIGRLALSSEFDAGRWGQYRAGLLAEYEESFIGSTTLREFWVDSATGAPAFNVAVPQNAQNQVLRRSYVTEGAWGTYYISGPAGSGGLLERMTDPVTGRMLSSAWYNQGFPNEFYYTNKMGMAVVQARYFDGRLVAAGGIRRDEVKEHQLARRLNPATNIPEIARDPATAAPGQEEQITRNLGTTKSLGLVYHVTPMVSLYYNRADNLAIPAKGQLRLPPSGEPGTPLPVPAPKGEGEDVGIGVELLDRKLYAKATYYTTKARNLSTTSPAPMRTANLRIMDALLEAGHITGQEHARRVEVGGHGLFDHSSKGWEFQVTANPTERWRFQLNYALTDAVENNKFLEWRNWAALTTQYLAAFPIDAVVTSSGNTVAEEIELYQEEFQAQVGPSGIGKLGNRRHKVSLVTRYLFNEGRLRGAYIGGAYRHQSRMFTGVDEALRPVYGNSYWRADLMAGYTLPWLENRLSLQLNVYNVFNERDPMVIRYDTHGAVFREVVQPPTTWRLTATYAF
jgi:iron complex outermembrane recepter protein